MNAKERLQVLRSVDAGIEALLELKRRMKSWTDEEWNQGAFVLGIVLPEAGAEEGAGEQEGMAPYSARVQQFLTGEEFILTQLLVQLNESMIRQEGLEQGAKSKEQEIRAKAKALGLSVLKGGLGNGWKN
jgi:hypothetical protein